MALVGLLTDFGTRDWYVASMKGVIADIAPHAQIIDITHDIPMGDVAAASFMLLVSHTTWPKGSIFVAVVDPGVGSARKALIGCANGYVFIGPDNGILASCFALDPTVEVRHLSNPAYWRPHVSPTFHGRDVFAPAAASMARGGSLNSYGPLMTSWAPSPLPEPVMHGSEVCGVVAYIDHFGNALTNIPLPVVSSAVGPRADVVVGDQVLPLLSFYKQVPPGAPLAVEGSCGYVEISVNAGSAAGNLGLRRGSPVTVRPAAKQ